MASKAQRAVTDVEPEGWARFGKALKDWREDVLGYEHRAEFARKAGINIRLVQDLEKNYRPGTYTKWKLDEAARAYEIAPATARGEIAPSMLAVLRGEADTFTRAVNGSPEKPAAIDPLALPPSPFADPDRNTADRPYALAIWKRYLDLPKNVTDPDGARMFPGDPDDAKAWDAIADMDIGDRPWVVADLQRRADGRAQGSGTGTTGALTSQLVRTGAAYAPFARDSQHGYRLHPA